MFNLLFLGTGTSGGVPEAGCDCSVCSSKNSKDKRLRTSVLLRTGDCSILIDSSIDVRQQLLTYGIKNIDYVLYTHAHADHILGLGDLRHISFLRKDPITILARQQHMKEIKNIFYYLFSPPRQIGGGVTRITPKIITRPFRINNITVCPLDIRHGILKITGFLFDNRFAYITDASHIPEKSMQKLYNLDVLILNALRYKKHGTHFTVDEALSVIHTLKPKRTYLVHMTHNIRHHILQKSLPKNVFAAYDGLTISI